MPEKSTVTFEDVNVVRRGDQIILPPEMTAKVAIDWITKRDNEENRIVAVDERMKGFPFDCANALALAVQERYGFKELRATPGLFGQNPPQFVNIPLDHTGKTMEVFIGRFGIPKLDPKSYLETYADGFDGMGVTGNIRARELPEVQALVELARQKLKTNSIYKAKAFRLEWKEEVSFFGSQAGFDAPEFLAPQPDTVKLLVNEETQFLIDASIWAMIRKTEQCRRLGIPLKRAALCEGPYGTGKTLLAGATGDLAVTNGWTFIYLKDINKLKEAYQMAARYAPCVLFAEDLDIIFQNSHADKHALLNVLDGVDSKGSEVMLILTTNYPEKLDQSILRPGRLDAVIPFVAPDEKTAQALVRHYAGSLLDTNADLTTVGTALAGNIPAVIREVVERSKLYAMAESDSEEVVLDEVSLLRSATGMRHHLDMLERQKPKGDDAPIIKALEVAAYYAAWGLANGLRDQDFFKSNPLTKRRAENAVREITAQ
jgi:hypothetical protein